MTIRNKSKRVAAFAGIAVSLIVVTGCTTGTAVVQQPINTTTPAATRSRPATSDASTYTDGVYTATGVYGNLPSSISVSVTLVDDVISALSITPHATNTISLDLQRRFAAAVPAVVVGRPIDEVHVDRLAGSSGTPVGFNAAIQRIKEQARSGSTTTE